MVRDFHESASGPDTLDWSPVRHLCRAVAADLPAVSAAVTTVIRATVPAYEAVPPEDHRDGVATQLRIRLAALGEHRGLRDQELAASADLAARRARQGIPVEALIAAHQAGDQEIWRLITERGTPGLHPLLPGLGQLMFAATSAASAVMARAHSRVSREIDGSRITLAHRFLDLLLTGPAGFPEAALVAARLGLDPNGIFTGLVWFPGPDAPADRHDLAAAVLSSPLDAVGRAAAGGRFEMVVQTAGPDAAGDLVRRQGHGGRLGIGLPRSGLPGASTSLADARIAAAATGPHRSTARFADVWPEALILAAGERIRVLTGPASRIAASEPHLAQTIDAFAAADMSIAGAAARLHLHANSVAYRLDRWTALTGLRARTFDGLVRSLIACRQAGAPEEAAGPAGEDVSGPEFSGPE